MVKDVSKIVYPANNYNHLPFDRSFLDPGHNFSIQRIALSLCNCILYNVCSALEYKVLNISTLCFSKIVDSLGFQSTFCLQYCLAKFTTKIFSLISINSTIAYNCLSGKKTSKRM